MSDETQTIRKFALQNAVFFNGKANPKAVVGKVLGTCPDLRSKADEVREMVAAIVEEVNAMGLEAQKKELGEMDPSMLVKEKKEHKYELPDLEGVDGKVVMRIAPGPSGPLHIGHTRASVLNNEYVKRYGGELVLRFEDTNPERIEPDAYDMIIEDLDWMGIKIGRTFWQSDRFEIYYDYTRKLLEMGQAYVCTCDRDHWKGLRDNMMPCPCHDLPVEEQLDRYDRFLAGEFGEGEAVVVVKTDLHHPNPAIRDFVALRINTTPHPRTGDKYIAYPMMNLAVPIDDYEMGMTHVIRGKDHLNNTFRQEYVFQHLGWKKPIYYHYGLVHVEDAILKTSTIGKGIKSGEYSGWDDVRLGTVRALERRGITAEAIRNYWLEAGIKPVDVQFSMDGLYVKNREVIDPKSNRYFFVEDPVEVRVADSPVVEGSAPKHPDHPERGVRSYSMTAPWSAFVASSDFEELRIGGELRLKDLCNVSYDGAAHYDGNDLSVLKRGVHAVQWVGEDSVPATLLMPDGTQHEGRIEMSVLDETGDMVQLERVGFARIEGKSADGVHMVYSHR